jgi:hypothetical protein
MKPITTNRETVILGLMFAAAFASVITLIFAVHFRPADVFQPLSVSSNYVLIDGIDGTNPPQIKSGDPLQFTRTIWCNNANTELTAHISATLVNLDTPPLAAVVIASGLPVAIPKGCAMGRNANSFSTPTPLPTGLWQFSLTISIVMNGREQVISRISQPFMVIGA